MKFSTRLLLIVFTQLVSLHLIAQGEPELPDAPSIAEAKGKIEGKVIDRAMESPLEFATVSVLSPADSTIITGEITDLDGNFSVEVPFGSYVFKVEFIGYRADFRVIELNRQSPVMALGSIGLNSNAEMLAEVEVRAEKSQLQMGLDKKVFNVGKTWPIPVVRPRKSWTIYHR